MTTGRRKKAAGAPLAVVFDTRVLLRGLRSDTSAQRLRQAWQSGPCRALVNPDSARALMLALACPALRLSVAQQHELLADYLPYAEVVQTVPEAGAPASHGRRLRGFEQLALELALGAGARWLVSDSPALRGRFSQAGSASASICNLVGSEHFLAGS